MTQKIKILTLEKTSEYITRELDVVHGIQRKLLNDSDWTQCIDTELQTSSVLAWRMWRHRVRSVCITSDMLDAATSSLNALENSQPASVKGVRLAYVTAQFNFTSPAAFYESCMRVLDEICQYRAAFISNAAQLDIPIIFAAFCAHVESIERGY
jgi:hypothetical protein